jgi:transcriptional regulator with XRE-family HTH domain
MQSVGATFDHSAFVAALERKRDKRGLSWNQVAATTGLEPSTLYRIVGGAQPDLARFAVLIEWLHLSADVFIKRDQGPRLPVASEDGPLFYVDLPKDPPVTDAQLQELQATFRAVVSFFRATHQP